MTKTNFTLRFHNAIGEARKLTMKAYRIKLPAVNEALLFGTGVSRMRLSLDDAVDRLYLGEQRFFKIIDVFVAEVQEDKATIFVRPSNHRPCEIHETWNNGEGAAPFKAMLGILKDRTPPPEWESWRR